MCDCLPSGNDLKIIDLMIIDDVFPHPVSGFRLTEFNTYLDLFDCKVFCTGKSSPLLGKEPFDEILESYLANRPNMINRVVKAEQITVQARFHEKYRIAYFCFLKNAYDAVSVMEENEIPFIFELYPGGMFQLESEKTNKMLRRVMDSKCFRKVIVTQDITRDYLLQHEFCSLEHIVMIFGVVIPQEVLLHPIRLEHHQGKALKICFASVRYSTHGEDKGYDRFISIAKRILGTGRRIEFHVIGNFDETVIPLDEIEGSIHFHGILPNAELHRVLEDMDIMVALNKNGVLESGSFDGFPTATCIEAGLCGVLNICTDPLELNNGRFRNHEEIEITDGSVEMVVEKILYYDDHRDELKKVIEKQYNRVQDLYSFEAQMKPRIELIKQELEVSS